MSKKLFYVKPEVDPQDESLIHGFDIEIDKDDVQRIDRLVDDYESRIMTHLDEVYVEKTTRPDRLADRIAQFGGSWRFIIWFGVFLGMWVIWNALPITHHFDGAPFILLNLCLSFIAAFQAPVIMMSQNRQAVRDKHEALIDFAINYKAEQEIDDMQRHLNRIEGDLIELKQLILARNKQETETTV